MSSKEEGDSDVEDVEDDSDLEEIKVQIIVRSKNIKNPTAKTLNIESVNYQKIIEKIDLVVQKALGKKTKLKDYIISYKAANARGPPNELEDELDFQEFISEYKKLVLAGKKMLIAVTIKDDTTRKKKSTNKHKKVKFFLYIIR